MRCFRLAITVSLMLLLVNTAYAAQKLKADVVVIGLGGSGLAATLQAAELGLDVIGLEKQDGIGGTANFSEGIFAVESKMQKAVGETFTKDQAFKMIMGFNHWKANPRLVRNIIDQSPETIDWLLKHNVKLKKEMVTVMENHPRLWHRWEGFGAAMVKTVYHEIKKYPNARLLLETPAYSLIEDKDGNIVGVRGRDLVKDEEVVVNAKAVIIATGGFSANKEMLEKYIGTSNLGIAGSPNKTGDGINMAFEVGAAEFGIDVVQSLGPQTVTSKKEWWASLAQINMALRQPYLWVNVKGQRFCDESIIQNWPMAGNAMEVEGGYMFTVYDQDSIDLMMNDGIEYSDGDFVPLGAKLTNLNNEFERGIKEGWAFKADSIEDLAAAMGVDKANLTGTVKDYNRFSSAHYDAQFAKDPKFLHPIERGPFYAVKGKPAILGTLGGIRITENTEVVDKNLDVINGLYAVGFDAGGMYGDTYHLILEGGTIGFAINSGRLAAKNAAQYLKKGGN